MKSNGLIIMLLVFWAPVSEAEPLYSPSWGFRLDLPGGYELSGGDAKNQFSFVSSFNTHFDMAIYTGRDSVLSLAEELGKKLSNRGTARSFTFNGRQAAMLELRFINPRGGSGYVTGWALCMELEQENRPLLAAIAYGPDREDLRCLHLSILDSIEGGTGDHNLPGPVTEYFHPRGEWKLQKLARTSTQAFFRENDARGAQALVDREFEVMKFYANTPQWQEAWKRFYRMIHKDSFSRLTDAAFILERLWNNPVPEPGEKDIRTEETERLGARSEEAMNMAAKTLEWVQGFSYERNLFGSDFVNLVSAAQEGRGDCDSRAMLWAIILEQANIPAGIMVSREYGHAMGLADISGEGARFPMKDGNNRELKWLVAETTAAVPLGRIGEHVSEISKWLGIVF
ncbi:MAG: hypothetical protein LBP60_09840 [Spirochaetaceae bacterium]|jgi:hypothetical protein|nr:hypothetical protein [Spirochaetaceae bacterium]